MIILSVVSMISIGSAGCRGAGSGGRTARDGFQKDSCRLIQRELEGIGQGQPAELLGFLVEADRGRAGAAAGVIEQDEMFLAIKLGRSDAILGEDELDVVDFELSFLEQFTAQGVFGSFAELYFSAGNAPEPGPFVGANHEDASRGVEDEGADGGDGRRREMAVRGGRRMQFHAVPLEEAAEFAKVFDDEIGVDGAELIEALIAGKHGAGSDAAVAGGFDVVLHVSDEQRFARGEVVFGEDTVDAFPFVADVEVGAFEKFAEAGAGLLHGEVIGMHGAEHEGADAAFAAEDEELPCMGEGEDGILDLAKSGVEPAFELFEGDMRDMAIVKRFERQREFGAELIECQWGDAGELEGVVAGLPDGGQIIDESA